MTNFAIARVAILAAACSLVDSAHAGLRAGAAAVDISAPKLPAIRNGGFLEAVWKRNTDPLFARCLVLDDGREKVAIAVVDSCMLPTDVCDAIKARVTGEAGIPMDRILVSATHTHSAPSTMALCLGTRRDEDYTAFLIPKVAEGLIAAHARLRPARAGWGTVDAPEFTNCRRWIFRSDKLRRDPFGDLTVRAMMHPGYENPDTTGPAGPIDPGLSLLSVIGVDGVPIAALANYSMHYFGSGAGFSADYFGEVARALEDSLGGGAVVGIMSQGTSGDLHWMDYSRPRRADFDRRKYAEGLAERATGLMKCLEHRGDISLAMAEKRMTLARRVPSPERLAWAAAINGTRGERRPKDKPEVYAEQAAWIHDHPRTEVVLQAIRIGELGIAALPNEAYGITGLKLKARSPLLPTFNIELANGAEGYIPPPEQHALGGYTTWPARTAGLEEQAEPKLVAALLGLLEDVSGRARRNPAEEAGPYARAVMADGPRAYWRLEDFEGPVAHSAVGKAAARFEDGIAFHLPGVQREGGGISTPPERPSPFTGGAANRAAHFAGGRMVSSLPVAGREYSVELWFWNAFPTDARPVTGYLFSRGREGDHQAIGEHLGIGGTVKDARKGRLLFYTGNGIGEVVSGRTELAFRDWHHVVLVRQGEALKVYLDGRPEIDATVKWTLPDDVATWFIGGRCDNFANFEGKIDEVAIYDRALTAAQVAAHFAAVERVPPKPPGPQPEVGPLEPQAALSSLHVPEGYAVELVAAEPLVRDPVAFDWDTRGRLWVVEMADYPLGLDGNGQAGGRVRCLEDRNGDGRMDHATLFAEGLNFPNGILTWRDGVIVTAAPDVLLLRDTDGDGRADQREVLLTGLTEGNQQLRANGLRWGLDNWVYVAAGGHHGKYGVDTKVRSFRAKTEVKVGSRDFRFRPDTGELEPASGPTQFGRNRDDWGHWFGSQNSRPLWHYVLPDHYLRRNPHYAAPEGRVLLPAEVNPPVYPAKPPQKRFHSFQQSGRYTSACSGMIYRDESLFPAVDVNGFACEPFHNLVQRIHLTPAGASFAGERMGSAGEPDFFASSDRWCRPVMVRTGPDGALWIADMYRYMIEHPQWLPREGRDELLPFYRAGDDRGRIYRIVRQGSRSKGIPDLEAGDVVTRLESANGWVRDKAQQLLLWRGDRSVVPALKQLVRQAQDPRTRVQALGTLDGLGSLAEADVLIALGDAHPGVRENALRLAEGWPSTGVADRVAEAAGDTDARVRLQAAFTLGQMPASDVVASALTGLLAAGEEHIVAAALSSLLPHLGGVLPRLPASRQVALRQELGTICLGVGDLKAFSRLLEAAIVDTRSLADLLELLGRHEKEIGDLPDDGLRVRLQARIADARKRIVNEAVAPAERLDAAALLARLKSGRAVAIDFLIGQIGPAIPGDVLGRILELLATNADAGTADRLLAALAGLPPQGRRAVIDQLLSRSIWTNRLLGAVEAGRIRASEILPTQRARLLKHPNAGLRRQAAKLLGEQASSSRKEVMARFRPALKLKGDATEGMNTFTTVCLICHKRGALGDRELGPDLITVVDHPEEKLLANILDPNLDIQPGYHAYHCRLRDGREFYGLIGAETASSITIRQVDGSSHQILRAEIATLRSADISLMPEGLEAGMTAQRMADLIAFLKQK